MYTIQYPLIDNGSNGSYIFYNNGWYQLYEVTGNCYNASIDWEWINARCIPNNDRIYDILIIAKIPTMRIERIK